MFLDLDLMNAAIQALGWALIHFLWQGAVVGATFALGMLLLRQARPGARYGFGLICMLVLALLPVATFVSMFSATTATAGQTPSLAVVPSAASAVAQTVANDNGWAPALEQGLPWVVLAWALGVGLHTVRVFVNWRRMRRLTRIGVRSLDGPLSARIHDLIELFGIRSAVRVFESTLVQVPTVLGWLKPVILLPTSTLTGLTPRQIELVIAHELGHIRRWDYIVNLMQVCIETGLFYHPVVGWISRRIREEREKCCDDLVIEHCGNRLEYAKALTNLESMRATPMQPALAATDGKLFERIERIVCNHAAEPGEAVAGNTLFLVILGLTVALVGRMADPLQALENRHTPLADALVDELLVATVPTHSETLLVPLESARFSLLEPVQPAASVPVEEVSAPTVQQQSAGSDDVGMPQRVPSPAPVERAAPQPSVVQESPVIHEAVKSEIAEPRSSSPVAAGVPTSAAAAPAEQPLEVASLDRHKLDRTRVSASGPVAVRRVSPVYPVRARMAGQSGYVEVSYLIDAAGRPEAIDITESRPRRVFERAALQAIRDWRFDPTTVTGAEGRQYLRFDFNLDGTSTLQPMTGECRPLTGTRICRTDSPTAVKTQEARG